MIHSKVSHRRKCVRTLFIK